MKIVFVLLIAAANALAIPTKVHYSGQLADGSGQPLDTVVAMTFGIYGSASGGASVWTEAHSAIAVEHGVFNVTLGSVTPLPDVFSVPRWLGVQVGADSEMVPREQFTSVAHAYRVGTVDGAGGGTISSSVAIGESSAQGEFSLAVGGNNSAIGDGSSVTGGYDNSTDGDMSHVGGGSNNQAIGELSVVGGGQYNAAMGEMSIVAGGVGNRTHAVGAAVLGGNWNRASDDYSVVCGGHRNIVEGRGSFIGGGAGVGFLSDSNQVRSDLSCIVGGFGNRCEGYASTIGGGGQNQTGVDGRYATVAGGYTNIASDTACCVLGGRANGAFGNYSVVVGGKSNITQAQLAIVCGGFDNAANGVYSAVLGGRSNLADGDSSTVVAGINNESSGDMAFVGGGMDNVSSATNSVVAGGSANLSSGTHAFIGGGNANIASGQYAAVPGGQSNQALGNYSVALGHQAQANNSGSFVYADNSGSSFSSSLSNQFNVRAAGGIRLYTNSGLSSGVTLAPGGSAWVAVSDSTKKRDIRLSDTKAVLDKVASLPIKDWEYKSEAEGTEHIGPMAQDFWNAFHLGSDSLGIETIDADGVLFAAVQELARQNEKLTERNTALETRLSRLEVILSQMAENGQNHLTSGVQSATFNNDSKGAIDETEQR